MDKFKKQQIYEYLLLQSGLLGLSSKFIELHNLMS